LLRIFRSQPQWPLLLLTHVQVYIITLAFTRAKTTRAAIITYKSTVTDHVCNENHVIDWDGVQVMDQESGNTARLTGETLWIRVGTRGPTN